MSRPNYSSMQIVLKRFNNGSKNVKEVYALLHSQPKPHYQSWGYGEPTMQSVRNLLSSNSVFGIYLEGNLVGIVGFVYKGRYFIPLYSGQYWVQYLIDSDYCGRGIATIALANLLDYIKSTTRISRIYAGIKSDNLASLALIKKFGFVKRDTRSGVDVFEKVL